MTESEKPQVAPRSKVSSPIVPRKLKNAIVNQPSSISHSSFSSDQ